MSRESNAEPAPAARKSIFRPRALEALSERQDRAVLPRFGTPRGLLVLWLGIALLTGSAAALLALLVRGTGG